MNFVHKSVLLKESVEKLNVKPDGIYVDGTLGAGGHSREVLKLLSSGRLIGIDRDDNALEAARKNLAEYGDKLTIVKSNFAGVGEVLSELKIDKIDGFLLDLGVSSHQFDEADRGFSYRFDAPLDMRMDRDASLSAWNVVNEYSSRDIAEILWKHADERWAKRIAEFIVCEREKKTIDSTFELVEVIKKAVPKQVRREGNHPAKRTFQAIRMEVNGELSSIERGINGVIPFLNEGARIVVISFHSIEDALVKDIFKKLQEPCECPKDFPVCVCGKKPVIKVIKPAVVYPSEREVTENFRAHSAKMRVAEAIIVNERNQI